MGFFDALMRAPRAENGPNPLDDYWYGQVGPQTNAGVPVSPDGALAVSAVYACVSLLAEMVATPELHVLERLANGGKQRARGHPLYAVLHDQPNDWQTSYQWRQYMMASRLLRGNGYARILSGPRGFVDQLIPLAPDRVRIERLAGTQQGVPGPIVYRVRDDSGREYTLQADEVFHLPGPLSSDGVTGLSVVRLARESIGLAIATESYGARFFSQNSVPRGVITVEGKLEVDGRRRLRDGWRETYGGLGNSHGVAVLDGGATFSAIGLTNEDSQFLETRRFQLNEISRWFRVPSHMLNDTERSTSWGSGIEHMSLGFILYTMLPIYSDWESAIQRDLVLAKSTYFAEFLVDTFLRGDAMTRAQSLQIQRQNGVVNADEWRALENRNPLDTGGGDYWMPSNFQVVGQAVPGPVPAAPAPAGASDSSPSLRQRAQLLAESAARRVVRKEVTAVRRQAPRVAGDAAAWRDWLTAFYDDLTGEIARDLAVPEGQARLYCETHRDQLLEQSVAAMEAWEAAAPPVLAELALGEGR